MSDNIESLLGSVAPIPELEGQEELFARAAYTVESDEDEDDGVDADE